MKKQILCGLLTFCMLFSALSCGNGGNEAPDTTQNQNPEETEEQVMINEKTLVFCKDNATNYSIIVPENASSANLKAADELQSYMNQISGVTIPIKTDAEPETEFEINVGYTNRAADGQFDEEKLGLEGFCIETVDKKLFIAGSGTRGALYGVYTFLEEYLGCRFYTSEYEKIPSRKTLVVQPIVRNEQIPIFEYRDINLVTSKKNHFQVKIKANGSSTEKEYGGNVTYVGFVHTFDNLVKPDLYRESHPEYWAKNEDGSQQTGWGIQLCLSNPDVLKIATESVRELLKNNPDANIISVSQNDSGNTNMPCMCEDCRKIYEEEGGAYSGAIIRFVNTIANTFAEEYPNVKFDTLAYRYSRSVCKTKPADNVIVRLCTIECCFSHPLGTCPDVTQSSYGTKSIAEDIADWGAITDNVYVWDYVTNFRYPMTIFPNFNTLLPNARFFAENSVIGVFEEGNYFGETGDFSDLRSYIMAKILWNPYMTEEEYWGHIDDFLEGVYGEGWTYIREYIDLAQDIVKDKHFSIYNKTHEELYPFKVTENFDRELPESLTIDMIKNYETTDWSPYIGYYKNVEANELITRGTELFEAALEKADEDQKYRIEKIKLQLDFLRSCTLYEQMQNASNNIEKLLQAFLFSEKGAGLNMTEKLDLIRNARAYVVEKVKEEYQNYNKNLCETALKYGTFRLREGGKIIDSENYTELKFHLLPDYWV